MSLNKTFTGDVVNTGGGIAMTIPNDTVTNAKAANMAQSSLKGRASGAGTGDPTDLTGTQAGEILRYLTVQSDSTSTGSIATYTINEATTQVRFSGSGTATIHGMTATSATFGKSVEFHVESGVAGILVFTQESGSAGAAGERIRTPGGETLYLKANESVTATYFDNRWRLTGVGKASAGRFPGAPIYDVMAAPFNAVGNGIADDTAAINAAIAAANAVAGDIYLGLSHRITDALTPITNADIMIIGRGQFNQGSKITVDAASPINVLTFDGCRYSGIRDTWISATQAHATGYGIRVLGAFKTMIDDVTISDMGNGIEIFESVLTDIQGVSLSDLNGVEGFYCHGSSTDACHGTRLEYCTCGTQYPAATVGSGRPWTISTAYIVGNIVTNGDAIYQCTTAGTSAGSGGPTGLGTGIVDGTAVWRFAMGKTIWYHHGSWAATFELIDCGGLQGDIGLLVEDDDPGVGSDPQFTRVQNFQIDHPFSRGIQLDAGASMRFNQVFITSIFNGHGIEVTSGFSGNWEFMGGEVFGCSLAGVVISAGHGLLQGMQIGACSTATSNTRDCIEVGASVSNFTITDCSAGSMIGATSPASRYGISIATGCTNYLVTGNRCIGNLTGAILNTPGTATTRVVRNNIPDVTVGLVDGDYGDVTVSSSGATITIDNDVVTNAKLANMSPGRVKGLQVDGSTGDPVDLTGDEVGELIRRFAVIADGSSSGSIATYAITNIATQVRFTGASAATIHGMTATSATFGKTIEFHVESGAAAVITFANESGSAGAAGERIRTPGGSTFTLAANESCWATYFDSRWRITAVSKAAGVAVTDGDKGDITVSGSGATWTVDTNIAKTWTGVHTHSGLTHTILATDDVRVETTAGGIFLGAGHTSATPANNDVLINATSGIAISAQAASTQVAASTGLVNILADTNVRVTTNGVERLEIQDDGAWELAGDTGLVGQVLISGGASSPPIWKRRRNYCQWEEDFEHQYGDFETESGLEFSAVTGTPVFFAQTSWAACATNTTGVIAHIANEANHPGIVRMSTGAVSGNFISIFRGANDTPTRTWIAGEEILLFEAVIRMPDTANAGFQIGFSENPTLMVINQTTVSNIIAFIYDTAGGANGIADTTIHCITREADGTAVNTDTAVAPSGWQVFTIRQSVLGTIEFLINDAVVATHNSQVPDTEVMNCGITLVTRTADSKDLDIDFVGFESQVLNRTA